jgi:hypothetical protein
MRFVINKIFIIVIIAVIGVVGFIFWYFNSTEIETVTDVISYKDIVVKTYTTGGDDSPVISWNVQKYLFLMANGDELYVDRKVFIKYEVGDSFTYERRVFK